MISFSQILLLIFVLFLLFGDIKLILSKIFVLWFNFKTLVENKLKKNKKKEG